jgi:hypothetical protein
MVENRTKLENNEVEEDARDLMNKAIIRAWKSLSHGKYAGFGYWAKKAVQFRELIEESQEPIPFSDLVKLAQNQLKRTCLNCGHALNINRKDHKKAGYYFNENKEEEGIEYDSEDGDYGCMIEVEGVDREMNTYVCGCQEPKPVEEVKK